MIKVASQALEKIKDFVAENPKTAMGLLGGGLGAVGGFALTAGGDENETPGERMKRRLKNALILGGLGAGAGSLLGVAKENFETAIPESITPPEEAISKNYQLAKDIVTNPITIGTGAGAGTWAIGSKLRNMMQKDLLPKMQVILHAAGDTGLAAPKTMSEARSLVPVLLSATQGSRRAKLLTAMQSQFGASSIEELIRKMQHYGIKTGGGGLMKLLRRNKWTAIPAAVAALAAGGTAYALKDR